MNIEKEINKLKAKPILFSTDMVRAIRENRKIETRRIVKFPKNWDGKRVYNNSPYGCKYGIIDDIGNKLLFRYTYKYLLPNDYLWVRETWQHTKCLNINQEDENYGYVYKASKNGLAFQENIEHWKWKPSIYMSKEACRLILKIESIGVERLQDITEESAINEGIEKINIYPYLPDQWKDYNKSGWFGIPQQSFRSLWIKINSEKSWNDNSFIWVIKFKKYIQL